ncbi:hypothetical protein HSX11_01740 [Oxalobacteraceae bacterium]|nr:hypothetical protein [Oxalobacteraceae bacterium]
MAIENPPSITPAPLPAAQRGDSSTFSDRIDNLVVWWETSPAEIEALAFNVEHNATEALSSANVAAAQAFAAIGAVGAIAWVSGTTYAVGDVRYSPITQYSYRRKVAGAGTTDPSVDTTNWGGVAAPVVSSAGGATVTEITSDLTLTGASNKYQVVTPAKAGLSVAVPSVSALPGGAGSNVLVLRNRAADRGNAAKSLGFDLGVKNSLGQKIGFLPPNTDASLSARATQFWESSDILPHGTEAFGQVGFSSIVAGTGGIWTKALDLGSGYVLLLVHGASLHAVIYDTTAKVFGSPALVRSGLSTAGGADTVAAYAMYAGGILVVSCPDNGTAMQSVVITNTGTTVNLGTMVPTTLTVAAVRIVDLIPVGTTGENFAVGFMNSTTTLRTLALYSAGGSSVVSVGAEATATTTSSVAAMVSLQIDDTFITLVSSATVLTARVMTVTAGTTTQVPGSSATTTVTAATNQVVRQSAQNGNWVLSLLNTTMKIVTLQWTGTTPTISAQTAVTAAVTTVNTVAVSDLLTDVTLDDAISVAVSGTDSGGRFITEISSWVTSGGITSLMASIVVPMPAAHTVVFVKNYFDVFCWVWQLATTTDVTMVTYSYSPVIVSNQYTIPGAVTYSQILQAADPLKPKVTAAKTTLRPADGFANLPRPRVGAVLDGSKPSLLYDIASGFAAPTRAPIRAINSLAFSGSLGDLDPGTAWVAAGPAPATLINIQKLRLL